MQKGHPTELSRAGLYKNTHRLYPFTPAIITPFLIPHNPLPAILLNLTNCLPFRYQRPQANLQSFRGNYNGLGRSRVFLGHGTQHESDFLASACVCVCVHMCFNAPLATLLSVSPLVSSRHMPCGLGCSIFA